MGEMKTARLKKCIDALRDPDMFARAETLYLRKARNQGDHGWCRFEGYGIRKGHGGFFLTGWDTSAGEECDMIIDMDDLTDGYRDAVTRLDREYLQAVDSGAFPAQSESISDIHRDSGDMLRKFMENVVRDAELMEIWARLTE